MTDECITDVTYRKPFTMDIIARIIDPERPEGLLSALGRQSGLNLAVDPAEAGVSDNSLKQAREVA